MDGAVAESPWSWRWALSLTALLSVGWDMGLSGTARGARLGGGRLGHGGWEGIGIVRLVVGVEEGAGSGGFVEGVPTGKSGVGQWATSLQQWVWRWSTEWLREEHGAIRAAINGCGHV